MSIYYEFAYHFTIMQDIYNLYLRLENILAINLQALKVPAASTPSIAYPPEVLRTIQQAKNANNNVALAQHKVAEAKQAAVIQQKIALAKEAAAREAAARYE